jgi:hypothetical protein
MRWSLRLYVKYANKNYPPNNPWLGCTLFGEEGYFLADEALMGAPPDGHGFIVY